MKKIANLFLSLVIMATMLVPFSAYAEGAVEAPVLNSIGFSNATVVGEFSPTQFSYELELDGTGTTPTLKEYSVSDGARLFVNYVTNKGTENGILVEVKNQNIASNYTFTYTVNGGAGTLSNNNRLKEFNCELGEVYPAINDKTTSYNLYIPSDMTELRISAVPQDVNAKCDVLSLVKLTVDQTASIEATVTAQDGSTRVYSFRVKRLDKTIQQVTEEMQSEDFTSFVAGELLHQKPQFRIAIISVAGGIIVLIVLLLVIRRYAVRAEDTDELDFFDYLMDEQALEVEEEE